MSDIREWDPVAINNSDPSPDGYPEGMLPSGVNNSDRETMASVRRKWQDADWFDWGHEVTYVSPTQFSVPGDVSAVYHVDRRVRVVMPVAGTLYGRITAVNFVTNTTVTVLWDSGQLALESGIQVSVGIEIANDSTSLPMYWIQNTFGLLDPDILCYQDKNTVDIDGGDIAKEVVLESLPNVQGQVANPNHIELNTLVGLNTSATLQAQLDALQPVGSVKPWPTTNLAPLNAGSIEWLICNGAVISQAAYPVLFGLIGHTFAPNPGGGDFTLPDLRGRTVFGFDNLNTTGRLTGGRAGGVGGLSARDIGNTGGEQEHTQVEDELAAHGHDYTDCQVGSTPASGIGASGTKVFATPNNARTVATGLGRGMNNVPPGLIMSWVIRAS